MTTGRLSTPVGAAGHLREHWPEYIMEAAGLGAFMLSACGFAFLLFHPESPVSRSIPSGAVRQVLMGCAMGATAVSIVYSPWGKRSGAHLNPAVTLSFARLGRVDPWDALFYIIAQFLGGTLGIAGASRILAPWIGHPAVNYVVTVPGPLGPLPAFVAELAISAILMSTVLTVSNRPRVARFTGLFAGALVALYISLEAPISGMSMNPARTFASAFAAHLWTGWWIYFLAPPLGMLLASLVHQRLQVIPPCAKLHHENLQRCIHCGKPAGVRAATELR